MSASHQQSWQQAWQYCQAQRWRLPLWCAGHPDFLQAQTTDILQQLPADAHIAWLGAPMPLAVPATQTTFINGQARQQVLGQQFDWLVVNTQAGIDWDLVAASMGCVKAGGIWLLLTTEPSQFANSANQQAKKVLSYPVDATEHVGGFASFVLSTLQQQAVFLLSKHQKGWCQPPAQLAPVVKPSVDSSLAEFDTALYANTEQQQAVAAIHQVVQGHRNRPLVLTAHRGRGKSATLGIAAAQLAAAGKQRLIITAPQPAAAAIALQHANGDLPSSPVLAFWPIDRLLAEQPAADLILVDEAAALPTPQLQALASSYSRLVFATTEHGYEGTGRGFQLRFAQYLQQHKPGWRQFRLQQPVRFAANDPLEQLSFALFLLASELPNVVAQPSAIAFKWLAANQLAEMPALLHQVVALATLAHYQTSVRDLWALLDDPSLLMLLALDPQQQLLGLTLVSQEGGFPLPLCQQIAAGSRRVQGHLAAQSLLYQLQLTAAGTSSSWRVQRIITTPTCQRQGIGRLLLQQLTAQAQQAGIALLTTSFGLTGSLLAFWQRAGFQAVRLSDQPNQRSNEHSVLMLSGLTPYWQQQIYRCAVAFQQQLGWQLQAHYQQLDPELLRMLAPVALTLPLNDTLLFQVYWFATQQRPLADSLAALCAFFSQHQQHFPLAAQPHWIRLCWQHQPLSVLAQPLDWYRQSAQQVLQLTHPQLAGLY